MVVVSKSGGTPEPRIGMEQVRAGIALQAYLPDAGQSPAMYPEVSPSKVAQDPQM